MHTTKIFEVTSDEVDAEPDEAKCDSCRYSVHTRFLLAADESQAVAMVNGETGDGPFNGFCGECLIGILRGSSYPGGTGYPEGGKTIVSREVSEEDALINVETLEFLTERTVREHEEACKDWATPQRTLDKFDTHLDAAHEALREFADGYGEDETTSQQSDTLNDDAEPDEPSKIRVQLETTFEYDAIEDFPEADDEEIAEYARNQANDRRDVGWSTDVTRVN